MIIFLHGPDDYRREEKKRNIIAEFREKHPTANIDSFDFSDKENFLRFENFTKNQSMFATDKFAILVNTFSAGAEESMSQKLAEELKQAAKQAGLTVLLSERDKLTKDFSFLSKKSANVSIDKFDYLEGKEWEEFIAKKAEESEVKLGVSALKFLARVYQNDTWRLVTELQKISSLGLGAKQSQPFGTPELEKLGLEIAPNFFGLLQGLKGYQIEDRMVSLEKLFSMQEPMPKIFNMLIYQWPEKLNRLALYDVAVKSGKLDYDEVLVDLVIG